MAAVRQAPVRVYSIDHCPFCIAARDLLDSLNIEYELTDMTGQPDRRQITELLLAGHRTAPLIVIDGEPIGGYAELEALHRRGHLLAMAFPDGQDEPGSRG